MYNITFAVSVYNIEKEKIDRCINSLVNQNVKECSYEVLLVDDGSEKWCSEYCDYLCDKYDRIRVIHKANGGLSSVRNCGIKNALGQYICFVDGDDFVEKKMAEELHCIISQYSSDMIGFGHFDHIGKKVVEQILNSRGEGKLISTIDVKKNRIMLEKALLHDFQVQREYPYFFGAAWTFAYNLHFLKSNSLLFDENLKRAQDSVFNLNVVEKAQNIVQINRAYYHYEIYTGSICHSYKKNPQQYFDVVEASYIFCEGKNSPGLKEAWHMYAFNFLVEMLRLHYFNRENHNKISNQELKLIIENSRFKEAIDSLDINRLSLKRKFIYCLLKKGYYRILSFFLKAVKN